MFSLFRGRSARRADRYVVLPLDDPRLSEHAQRLANFAREHSGAGHRLRRVSDGKKKGLTIICACSRAMRAGSIAAAGGALMEDENIDDNGDR